MAFRTSLSKASQYKQTLSKMVDEFGYYLDDNGNRKFGKIGERNAYADIQRDKNSTDWSIMKKYLFDSYKGGDIPGVYGDRSLECSDLIEADDFLAHCQSMYESLPQVVKNKYQNLMEFVNGFNQEDFKLFGNLDSINKDSITDSKGVKNNEE